ncbi:structural maintenance of chromosomes protein 3-like [Anopheles coustani]|uniref:structural maintenance of chromosomes protein 3-like n=1 Tax=Anopheles coustani TaxID=139045 RepID=UPI0026583C4D|nr:structural maintenance of chromosomes protein 3-like [Anopheles coustani]
MYIKQIIIHGFKSYSKKTTIEDVDKRHNVVVGRNGSGKSNFFSAIEFVLSNEYNNLRLEQRKALINQAGNVAFAFVEIIFDNRDAQLPVDREVVHIRRTISQSKDQYTLDGKAVPRKEVVQFLEMGGLSNASPYYIVKQGKINQLATARPFQLLQVLLEVSGIRSYNEQRESSLASMKQTESDMKIVLESRARHGDEIKILKEELMEFEQYEKLDKKRRVIKFVMLYNEKTEIGNELNSLGQATDKLKEKRHQLAKRKVELLQREDSERKQLKQLQGMITSVVEQKSTISKEHHRYVQIKTNLELKVEDLTKDLASESQRQAHSKMQLDKLNKKIQEQKDKLNELVRQCAELHHQEDNLASELKHKEQMRGEHLDKQRRGVQFASRVERDCWLKEEIASLKKQIHTNTIYINDQDKELDQRKKTIVLMEQKMDDYNNTFQKISERMDSYKVQINQLKVKRDDLLQHQQNLWEQISRVQQELAKHKEDFRKIEQMLKKQINSQVITGGDSIRKVIDRFRSLGSDATYVINGYFGQIIDNIECDESIYKAVETTAGMKLFNHVVESNDIAKEIIQVFNQQKLPGTFQFMPLNLLATHKYQYPSEKHAVPLISLLKYEKKLSPAIQMVFGKTILCSDLSLMPESALKCGLTCVTYEGDQNLRGVLKGGYHAPKPSILKLHRDSREVWKEIIALEEELVGLQTGLDQTVCRVTECERKMSQEEAKLQKFEHVCEMERIKKQSMPESLRQQNAACELLERKIRGCKNEQELMRSREKALIAELETELTNKLTEEDQKAIEQLDGEIREIRLQQQTLFNSALDANKAKHKVENLLNSNLMPKRDELVRSIEESANREDKTNELAACWKRIQSAEEKINYYLEETTKLEENSKSFQERKESLQKEQKNLVEKQKKLELEMDSIAADENEATKKQDLEKNVWMSVLAK